MSKFKWQSYIDPLRSCKVLCKYFCYPSNVICKLTILPGLKYYFKWQSVIDSLWSWKCSVQLKVSWAFYTFALEQVWPRSSSFKMFPAAAFQFLFLEIIFKWNDQKWWLLRCDTAILFQLQQETFTFHYLNDQIR